MGENGQKYRKKVDIVRLAAPVQSVVLLDGSSEGYCTNHLLFASAIAILVATGLFLYTPIVLKVERGSIAWGLLWIAVITLGSIGYISDAEPWALLYSFPRFGLRCFTTCAVKRRERETTKALASTTGKMRYELCRLEEGKVKLSFFKAPQKSQ